MKKVIISGATSMLGTALINECIKNNVEVIALVRTDTTRRNRITVSPLVHIVECNLAHIDLLDNEMLNNSDAFIHLAWDGTSKADRDDPVIQESNIQYTLKAVRLVSRVSCKKFIGIGSQAEYGRVDGIISPDSNIAPDISYGIAKYSAGRLSHILCDSLGIAYNWGRVFSVYGIWDNSNTLIRTVLEQLEINHNVNTTMAEQVWDYLYVKDAARAIFLIADRGYNGKIYNIGSGKVYPLKEYLETIQHIMKSQGKICYGTVPYSENQVMHLEADITSLSCDTGFKPQYTFQQGIRETLEWMRNKQ